MRNIVAALLLLLSATSACGGKVTGTADSGTGTDVSSGTGTGMVLPEHTTIDTATCTYSATSALTEYDFRLCPTSTDTGMTVTTGTGSTCLCNSGGEPMDCMGTGTDTATFGDGGCARGAADPGTPYMCFFMSCPGPPSCAFYGPTECVVATETNTTPGTSTATMTGSSTLTAIDTGLGTNMR
jgi:hypothetical protein